MRIFTVQDTGDRMLCDTPTCHANLRHYRTGDTFGKLSAGIFSRQAEPRVAPCVETILCVVRGELTLEAAGGTTTAVGAVGAVGAMRGAHIAAGQAWSAVAGPAGAQVLRVDSFHPGFEPSRALMPALPGVETFAVEGGASLTYTDYFRSAVLTFAPGFAAERHLHEGADEVFWFFGGTARVTTPGADVTLPEGSVVINQAGEWHVIANASDTQPLLMFFTVAPNVVPSHTFFDAAGRPDVRSTQPLTHA